MRPYKVLLLLAPLLSPLLLYGQSEITSFTVTGRGGAATTFVTDYQAIGINPANLGWESRFEDKKVTFGLAEGSYSVFAEALRKDEIRNEFRNFDSRDFNWSEKADAAQDFAENGFAINVDFMSIGAAYATEEFGGLAFSVRDRLGSYINLSPEASDILFRGYNADYFDRKFDQNGNELSGNYDPDSVDYGMASDSLRKELSELAQGTELDLNWYREFNLSYGRKLIKNDGFSLYAGAGVKYLRGFGMAKIRAEDGEISAFSSTSPAFGIDYGEEAVQNNPSADTTNNGFLPDAVGQGVGFDLGANVVIGEKLKIGAAVNNIGSITWDGNVYTVKDTIVFDSESPGANSYNFFDELDNISGDSGIFRWDGEEKRKVRLPTVARLGASYQLTDKIEVGGDLVVPMNDAPGNYRKAIIGVGGSISLLDWLEISAGVKSSGYGDVVNIPVGLVLRSGTGGYEAGIASRDAVTFFSQNQPTLSLSTGFLRFRF